MMFEQFTPNQSPQGDQAFSGTNIPWFQAKGKRLLKLLHAMVKPGLNSAGLGLLLLLGGGSTAAWGAAQTFTTCQTGTPVTLNKLSYEPSPPRINQPWSEIFDFDTKVPITSGATMQVTAMIGKMVVAQQTIDVCKQAKLTGRNCPIEPGNRNFISTINFPVKMPPFVTINMNHVAKNSDGSVLMCIDSTQKFLP